LTFRNQQSFFAGQDQFQLSLPANGVPKKRKSNTEMRFISILFGETNLRTKARTYTVLPILFRFRERCLIAAGQDGLAPRQQDKP